MMKRLLLTLLFPIWVTAMAYAQTAGEKNSFETMKNAADVYMLNGDFTAAKAQYEGILKLFRQCDSFTKQIRPDYEKCLKELDKAAAVKKESERLVFSEPFVNFAYTQEAHSVTVTAGKDIVATNFSATGAAVISAGTESYVADIVGSTVGANGETVAYKNWNDLQCTVNNTDGFKVYIVASEDLALDDGDSKIEPTAAAETDGKWEIPAAELSARFFWLGATED